MELNENVTGMHECYPVLSLCARETLENNQCFEKHKFQSPLGPMGQGSWVYSPWARAHWGEGDRQNRCGRTLVRTLCGVLKLRKSLVR